MSKKYSGSYKSKAFCCYAIFRILYLILAVVCLIFCILSLVLPLLALETDENAPRIPSTTLLTFTFFHLKGGKDVVEDPTDMESVNYEIIEDVSGKSRGVMTGSTVCAVIALVAAALSFVFAIVYLALLCAHQSSRRRADEEREGIYDRTTKETASSHSFTSGAGSREPYGAGSDEVIPVACSQEEVDDMNRRLEQMRKREQSRRRVDKSICIVLFIMVCITFIAALIAVILFAVYKSDSIELALQLDAREILNEVDADVGPWFSFDTSKLPYKVGFILLIIVIPLSLVLAVLVPVLHCVAKCGRDTVKDKTIVVAERERQPVPPPLLPPPVKPLKSKDGKPTYPEAEPGPYGTTTYGVPIDQDGPPPEQPRYRELGLPTAAYRAQADQ
ncbi:hypothetical protein AGDE_15129 [Angomonas deanei]|uniref:Uncharacterized protein n=1 Tax=Angomonas deanei TaxID=59799 RepID=A0A7G2CDJ2_9TRYP|nr:hypothetical protein AGDE_15129 [Angomonas deanei]CAD2217569.1 hypothetical protein, conserved [Angomonas deanei]|eukprot:EPY19653.1 hypothetical protein AGDE_15129 [Angomonas deanei]